MATLIGPGAVTRWPLPADKALQSSVHREKLETANLAALPCRLVNPSRHSGKLGLLHMRQMVPTEWSELASGGITPRC
jgi:hypothetical protein